MHYVGLNWYDPSCLRDVVSYCLCSGDKQGLNDRQESGGRALLDGERDQGVDAVDSKRLEMTIATGKASDSVVVVPATILLVTCATLYILLQMTILTLKRQSSRGSHVK